MLPSSFPNPSASAEGFGGYKAYQRETQRCMCAAQWHYDKHCELSRGASMRSSMDHLVQQRWRKESIIKSRSGSPLSLVD